MNTHATSSTYLSIEPANIGLEGGDFKITGTNLSGANQVVFKIDGESVQGVTKLTTTDTTISGKLFPLEASDAGKTLTVTIYTNGKPQSTDLTIDVKTPQLNSIDSTSGPISGGAEVTIHGNYLTGANQVLFATLPATIKSVTDTSITVVTPKGLNPGVVNVRASVQSVSSNAVQYTYALKTNIPLTINTGSTGLSADTPVYIYIVGEVKKANGDKDFYWINAQDMPVLMSTSDNSIPKNTFPHSAEIMPAAKTALKDNYQSDWANFSIPIGTNGKATTLNLANLNATNIPGLGTGTHAFSGRIYLSVGVPILPFTVHESGYVAPVFYDGAGEYTLFDWIEFSFDSLQNFNANTTMVDQFGLSLTLSVTATNIQPGQVTKVGLNTTCTRNDMVEVQSSLYAEGRVIAPRATTEQPTGNYKSVYPPCINSNVGDILRVLSPGKIVAHPKIAIRLNNYYDVTLEKCYKTWKNTPLVVEISATESYSAMADANGALHFKTSELSTLSEWKKVTAIAFTFSDKITTKEIWQCDGMLSTGGPESKNAGKVMAAAFNRGIMKKRISAVAYDVADYYPIGVVSNHWALQAHQYSLHRLAYGFAYDDVCSQNPSIGVSQPDSVEIKIENF